MNDNADLLSLVICPAWGREREGVEKGIGVLQQHFLELVRHVIQVLLGKIIVSYIHEPVSPALLPGPPCLFSFYLFFNLCSINQQAWEEACLEEG